MPRTQKKQRSILKWAVLAALLALISAPWLIGPRCPDHLVIATGGTDGAYFRFANEYRQRLAKHGIKLEIRVTSGSVENVKLLENSEVDLAMVQGGIGSESNSDIESLASLYPEPIWIFHRADKSIETVSQLAGLRIAVGSPGSGVREVALDLLGDNGITPDNAKLLDGSNSEVVSKLESGTLDAAFLVISSESAIIQELLESDQVNLLSISRASAYQKRHPFLSRTVLPEGVTSFTPVRPETNKTLLATTANLVVNHDLHRSLVPLLLQTVRETHQESDCLLESADQFPNTEFTDFPLNADAKRYFETGPSMLYRVFPFGFAAWLDRVKLFLLPMLTLLIPFIKVAPPVYRWRIRSKIYRWYRVLHDIDQEISVSDPQILNDTKRYAGFKQRLNQLERELLEVTVPLSYMEEFYNLRIHVSYVTNKLNQDAPAQSIRIADRAA